MLWILAGVSIALLAYEGFTLGTAVLSPLVNNPNALQTDFHYYYDAAVRFRADPSQLYRLSDDVIAGFAYPPPAILPFVALSHAAVGRGPGVDDGRLVCRPRLLDRAVDLLSQPPRCPRQRANRDGVRA